MASAARAYVTHLPEHSVLRKAYLACAVAFGAGFHLAARFSATAFTFWALLVARQVNFAFYAESCFFKTNFHIETQIAAALRACLTAASGAPAAAKEHIKNVLHTAARSAEAAEIKPAETARAACSGSAVKGCMTKLVILGTFLFVAQNTVCFGAFFKLFCSIRIILVDIRMILTCQFTICFFYLVCRCAFRNAQHVIVISFFQGLHHPKLIISCRRQQLRRQLHRRRLF